MENKIYQINTNEAKIIKEKYQSQQDIYIAELDGKNLRSWSDYISEIQEIFHFPTKETNMNAYLDWMDDLSWLNKEGYVLFLYNFKDFLKNDTNLRKEILEMFTYNILPWWQNDVELYVVDGKAKPFNVYLVD